MAGVGAGVGSFEDCKGVPGRPLGGCVGARARSFGGFVGAEVGSFGGCICAVSGSREFSFLGPLARVAGRFPPIPFLWCALGHVSAEKSGRLGTGREAVTRGD